MSQTDIKRWFTSRKKGKGGIDLFKRDPVQHSNENDELPHIMEVDDDEIAFLGEKCRKAARCDRKRMDSVGSQVNEVSLIDRFPPTEAEHLAVHGKKIQQMRDWILRHRNSQKEPKLLLLTGPCGCGKTATVKVLCRELKMELVEWEEWDHYDFSFDNNGQELLKEQSQVRMLANFLKSVDQGSLDCPHSQKVVLIENLPNAFYLEPASLHSLLRTYTAVSRCMFVFVLSSVESCWSLNPRRLLPTALRNHLHADTIAFNPSAFTFLAKAIRRIIAQLNITATPAQIKYIAESSAGDIRCAINNLQLAIGSGGRLLKELVLYGSSSQADPFHSFGKLLYAKRAEQDSEEWSESERELSECLKKRYHRPRPPKDSVDDVIQKTAMTGDNIATYLEEHEPFFASSMSGLSAVINNMSLMDSALGSWQTRTNPSLSNYEAEVAARSTLFYNYGFKYNSSRGLHSFVKPRWWSIRTRIEAITREARTVFPHSTCGELFKLLLPMLSAFNADLDVSQRQLLSMLHTAREGCAESQVETCSRHNLHINTAMSARPHVVHTHPNAVMLENHFDIDEVDDDWPA